ncbi:MAG: hypothetical protein R3D00_07090 [Bacteroidia bacterium]
MTKSWVKISEGKYTLTSQDKEIGKLEIKGNAATVTIGRKQYFISRTGFWKNRLEIRDENRQIIIKTYPKRWYSNASVLEYNNLKYTLVIRNNPLAEYAITYQGKDILAYGLETRKGYTSTKITNTDPQSEWLFDFLLWYLFVSIAEDITGEDVTLVL